MARFVFALILAAVLSVGGAAYRHYADSYSATLSVPNESWMHDEPRFYSRLFQDAAGLVRDNVYFVGGEASVTVMSKTDPLVRTYSTAVFESDFRTAIMGHLDGATVGRCDRFRSESVTWSCYEWSSVHEGIRMYQRAYLGVRGNSKLVVLFTVPADAYSLVGDPRDWLRRLRWRGPGIAYAF